MNRMRSGWLFIVMLGVLLLGFPTAATFAFVDAQNMTMQPTASPAPVLFSLYRAATYNLDYPSNWKIVPRSATETFFGTTPAPACGQPGLLVTLLGAAGRKTADILLDDYTANNAYLSVVGSRDDANDLGRFQVFRGPCTDGSIRVLRVAMFVAFGSGYRVTAFAPKTAYDQWDAPFRQIDSSFSVTADEANSSTVAQPVYAPGHAPDTLLVHIFDGNVYMANVADVPGTPLTRDGTWTDRTLTHYVNPLIAPDGRRVAFVQRPGGKLYIAAIGKDSTAVPTEIIVESDFPLAWSPDGAELAYVAAGIAGATQQPLTVQALRLDNHAVRTLGTLPIQGCTADTDPDPATALWIDDVNAVNAGLATLALEWPTTGRLLVSNDCIGKGLDLLDVASGQLTPLTGLADATNLVLSLDKTTVAAITGSNLALTTLADQQNRLLPIKANRLAWSTDNRILFYATRSLSPSPTSSAAATISGTTVPGASAAPNVARYDLTIHEYNLLTNQDITIYNGVGFGISTIAPAPDGSGLLFTIIQDDSGIMRVPAGLSAHSGSSLQNRPLAQVYWLTLPYHGGQSPTLLLDSLQVAFGPLGSTAVIGVPVKPHAGATNIPGG